MEYLDEGVHRTSNVTYCKKYYGGEVLACRKVKIEAEGRRYLVKSIGDLERLVKKERHGAETVVKVTGQKEDTPTARGYRLAEKLELGRRGAALEKEMTWEELRGACSTKGEVKCKTGRKRIENQPQGPEKTRGKGQQTRQQATECKQKMEQERKPKRTL